MYFVIYKKHSILKIMALYPESWITLELEIQNWLVLKVILQTEQHLDRINSNNLHVITGSILGLLSLIYMNNTHRGQERIFMQFYLQMKQN